MIDFTIEIYPHKKEISVSINKKVAVFDNMDKMTSWVMQQIDTKSIIDNLDISSGESIVFDVNVKVRATNGK